MIQFNLLPDVKIAFEKTRRLKRIVMLAASALSALMLVMFVFLLVLVYGIQKHNISDLNNTINTDSKQLEGTPSLNKILTIQNQLAALPNLDSQKPVASRLFQYLTQITPAAATISSLTINFTPGADQIAGGSSVSLASTDSVTVTGDADTWATVNTYIDTLKFTTFTENSSSKSNAAFSDVVLQGFSISSTGVTYSLSFNFNPAIFNSAYTINLVVPPGLVTTRSDIDQPTDLFQKSSSSTTGGQ